MSHVVSVFLSVRWVVNDEHILSGITIELIFKGVKDYLFY